MDHQPNTNLLKETLHVLDNYRVVPDEVEWVGSQDGSFVISWATFYDMAEGINYDSGFGMAEIAEDLVIVGKDWWLERSEYDGSEGWDFKRMPVRREFSSQFNNVTYRQIDNDARYAYGSSVEALNTFVPDMR